MPTRLRADRRRHDARAARRSASPSSASCRSARRCCARARGPATTSTSSGTLGDARLGAGGVSRPVTLDGATLRAGAPAMELPQPRIAPRHRPARRRDQRHRRLRRPARRPAAHPAALGRRCVVDVDALPRSAVLARAADRRSSASARSPAATTTSWCSPRLASRRDAVVDAAARVGVAVTRIGRIDAGRGPALGRPQRRGRREPASARSTTSAPERAPHRSARRSRRTCAPPPLAGARSSPAAGASCLAHPAHAIAIGFGSGLSPVAPGTVGTLWAWLVYALFARLCSARCSGRRHRAATLRRLVGLHGRPRATSARPTRRSIVWDEMIAFWLMLWLVTPASFVAQAWRLRAVPHLRRRQARSGRVGRPRLQVPPRRADRLGAGLLILFDDVVAALCTLVVIAVWRFV